MPPTYPNDPVDRGHGHEPSIGDPSTESASDVAPGSSLVGPDATHARGPGSETMPLTRAGSVEEATIAAPAAPGTEPMVAEPQTGPATVSVPGYRVLREIARGGMGRVLAALDLSLDRDVALKILLPGASADRFVRESKITARLPHPGIPPVHALGTLADGSPFLAMKLIAGQTLADELKTADRPRLLQVFRQVCQAVGFAHSRGVIHRDLKPANVMVGAFGEVQVMDWGLAKDLTSRDILPVSRSSEAPPETGAGIDSNPTTDHISSGESTQEETQAGTVMGTPAYMGPEQARGEATDTRADVFALGGILCAILTGLPPFTGKSSLEVLQRAAAGDLADANARLDGCGADPELIALAKHCLAPEMKDRPRDAVALAERISTYLQSVETKLRETEVERAAQAARLEQQRRSARKLRMMITGLAAVALIAGAACVAALFANQRANTLAHTARQNEQKANESQQETAKALTVVESQKASVDGSLSKARAAETQARASEEQGRRLLYATDMQLLPFIWKDPQATGAQLRSRLDAHRPAQNHGWTGKADLRGFEWYYYQHLLESSTAVFSGYSVSVVGSAFTGNGQLVTLDQNGRVRHWDLKSQDEDETGRRDVPGGPGASVRALSPDGRLVALAEGNVVRVFEASTGQQTSRIDSADTPVRGLFFSRDGNRLVIVNDKIRWCKAASGEVIATVEPEPTGGSQSLALSADGLTLAIVGHGPVGGSFSIVRLDATTRKVIALAKDVDFGSTIIASALSPEGQLLAVGGIFGGALPVFDTTSGHMIARHPSAHALRISAIAFSGDGANLATADAEGTIKVWADAQKLNENVVPLRTLKGHQAAITTVGFSIDGKQLTSGSTDKTARVWDLNDAGAAVRPLEGSLDYPFMARFSPDGQLIAAAGGRSIRLWDAATGRLVRQLSAGDNSDVYSVTFSPTDYRLLAVGYGGQVDVSYVALWDIDSGTERTRLTGANHLPNFGLDNMSGSVSALAFSPDGKYLAAGFGNPGWYTPVSSPNPLMVWEVATRRLIRQLNGHTGYCVSLDFSRDGTLLASGSRDGTAIIWSTETWKATQTLLNPDHRSSDSGSGNEYTQSGRGMVDGVAFSPDGKTLAMASCGGNVHLWHVATREPPETLKGHSSLVHAVVFSPDGRTLASGSTDQTVRLWNVETGRELMQLDHGNVARGLVASLAFSPDGKQLLARGDSNALWSAAPILWNDSDRTADKLRHLLYSNADFQNRIWMFSENLRLYEALEKLDSRDVRVRAALAATRANWHASRHAWPQSVAAFDRLMAADPTEPEGWLRAPGLLRMATALFHQERPAAAAMLLQGGAKRGTRDGLPAAMRVNRFGFVTVVEDGAVRVTGLVANSPASRGKLLAGDVIVKVNGVEMAKGTIPNLQKMLEGGDGTKVRLTVRHQGVARTEDVDLVKENYCTVDATGELFLTLLAVLEKRLAAGPRNAGLFELRAELAGQAADFSRQVADYSAAIEILAEQPSGAVSAHLTRLYRRRGDAYLSLQKWQEGVSDYAHVVTQQTQDVDLLSNRARAHEALKNWDAAAADWSRAVTGNPQGAKLLAEFARRLAAGGQAPLAIGQFEKARTLYERSLQAEPENDVVAAELAQLLLHQHENANPARWTILQPTEMKSEGGATLRELDDHSILAGGKNPPQDVYTVTFRDLPARIQGLRLEALPHESLTNGPGRTSPTFGAGNFLLTTLKAQLDLPTNPVESRILKLAKVYADFSDPSHNVNGAIDANDNTGWSIWPEVGKPHQAMFELAEPVALTNGSVLRVTLEFKSEFSQHQLGHFRLSTSEDSAVFARHRFLAMKLTDPWAKLAAAYRSVGDQHALDKLLARHPEATVGLGDLCAADQDWERAISEYLKLVTDGPADGNLLAKLATAYQSAGRTREAIPYLATASAANPADTLFSLRVAALQAWFGQEKELAETRQTILAFAKETIEAMTAEVAAKACSILPSTDKGQLELALALGRRGVKLGPGDWEWGPMALGMAEYRSGNDAAAELALLAAAKAGPNNPNVTGTSAFYRAMSLFRQGKKDEAEKLAIEAAAKMRPLPRDENNPLAKLTATVGGSDSQEDLITWLAYKEAKALIKFDAPPATPTTPDGK